jgi:hypothetical protein
MSWVFLCETDAIVENFEDFIIKSLFKLRKFLKLGQKFLNFFTFGGVEFLNEVFANICELNELLVNIRKVALLEQF